MINKTKLSKNRANMMPLNKNEIKDYLNRIKFDGEINVDISTLKLLHGAHIESIPFENLDISLGNKITLSLRSQFNKVIYQKRGGFCYELNNTFAALLLACGFSVKLLSASVFFRNTYGPEFDHLLILVECEGKLLITDVGFGNSFREPLFLTSRPVKQLDAFYKIERKGLDYTLLQKKEGMTWQVQYMFTLECHKIDAFSYMCEYLQTSAESHFTQESICSIPTKYGRKTLTNNRYIETINGKRNEFIITNEEQYRRTLNQHFSISLPSNISQECWKKLGL